MPAIVPPERYGAPMMFSGDPEDPAWLAALTCSDGVAYVHTFGLAPHVRGGYAFMTAVKAAIQAAREVGALALQCNVHPDDTHVLRGFTNLGTVYPNWLLTVDLRKDQNHVR
ncbi:MAG: hypothetical protein GF355_09545 [Candidatus Eisenbacteria bacterium]|nr:hypothetical protein [Candidatus Eisenbacteria bacterium]